MWLDHTILFLGWVVFYSLHSFLLAPRVKDSIKLKAKTYRLLYSIFSLLSIGLVLLIGAVIPSPLLLKPDPVLFYIGLMLATLGIFVIKRAFRSYSLGVFLGFKSEKENTELKTEGLQGKVRHPLYSGTILIFLGYFIYNPLLSNAITFLALLLYLPIGIRLEEQKLIARFGQEYQDYKNSVPAICPRIFVKKSSTL